ncbi:MAG: hypothetical protein JW959_04125 [Pirellulales bacterium]|nr:hypothetical protein [Pirellulales bacterium]
MTRQVMIPLVPIRIYVAASAVCLMFLWCVLLSPAEEQAGPPDPSDQPSQASARFGFESGTMKWIAQDYKDSRACVRVTRSEKKAHSGKSSLAVVMDLVGGDPNKSKGEVWINLKDNPPAGAKAPVNLVDRTLKAWVLAPGGAHGERSRPNGFQLFVKDVNWKSFYGSWENTVEERWVQLSLSPQPWARQGEYVDEGFDPSRIIAIGVKMACGDGSAARFAGEIYLDDVDW